MTLIEVAIEMSLLSLRLIHLTQALSAAAAASPVASQADLPFLTLEVQHGVSQQMQESAPILPLQCQRLGLWGQSSPLTTPRSVTSGQLSQSPHA